MAVKIMVSSLLKKVAIKRNYNQILMEMSRISRCIGSAKNCFDSKPSLNQ